ncbi:MAG: IPTL-CTERM sorting domain-containing protein, partial [Deltaproteobacteria bacterium]|nr:IPTL-CTERM sorting domain-containing protein [Deltaproteobacteria bacterium]
AYVFVRSGVTWTQQKKLTADVGAIRDYFGHAVALSGETALVGARGAKVGSNDDQGAVYVFVRSGTTWTPQEKLTADDGAADDEFGNAVALSGATALVGARDADVGGNDRQGAVYVFVRSGATWTQQEKLTADDGAAGDDFGRSVALSGATTAFSRGATALVGAREADVGGNRDQGAAYVFHVPIPRPIPTMTEWGMIMLALLLAGSAIWAWRRRIRII